jgi:hypothetical protein
MKILGFIFRLLFVLIIIGPLLTIVFILLIFKSIDTTRANEILRFNRFLFKN